MQGEPGFKILIPRFQQRKFSRPFGIEALILRINTGFFQLQPIENLDRFEFNEPTASQPGGDDILCKLSVRAGGGADGGGTGFTEYAYRFAFIR